MCASASEARPLVVMTRNVYLGADLIRPALEAAAAGPETTAALLALGRETHRARAVAHRTDFRVRSRLLAAEVARTTPHLVGLQEVALWRHGPTRLTADGLPDPACLGVPDATTLEEDFLGLLLEALADAGVAYRAVHVSERADVEGPAFAALPTDPDACDVRVTLHDVVLAREGVEVTGSGEGTYAANLKVDVAGVAMAPARGYQWVDLRLDGRDLRFVNTHLEAFSCTVGLAQARELAAAVPADRPVVVVGDLNSDPDDESVPAGEQQQRRAPYAFLTGPGGFTDPWPALAPSHPGFTFGCGEALDDPAATVFCKRIDFVLARTADRRPPEVLSGEVTGTSLTDRDPETGLWPSDHGGVVLRLRGL